MNKPPVKVMRKDALYCVNYTDSISKHVIHYRNYLMTDLNLSLEIANDRIHTVLRTNADEFLYTLYKAQKLANSFCSIADTSRFACKDFISYSLKQDCCGCQAEEEEENIALYYSSSEEEHIPLCNSCVHYIVHDMHYAPHIEDHILQLDIPGLNYLQLQEVLRKCYKKK